MELQNITVTDIRDAVVVDSRGGKRDQTVDRKNYAISLCRDGQITYVQNGKRICSDRDHAVLLPQGQSYTILREKTGSFPVLNFYCREELCDTVTAIQTDSMDLLLELFEKIRKLLAEDGSRAKSMSLFYQMLDLLSKDQTSPLLAPALRYAEEHYSDPDLSCADLGSVCKISQVYLRKLFSKELHVSPKQYVIDLRLQKAKSMLDGAPMKVSAISEACGFSNFYHFCRCFKQKTGLTPSQYRKQNQALAK